MSANRKKRILVRPVVRGLRYIASWQCITLTLLLLLVWVNELLDVPSFYFGVEPREFSVTRACIASAGVLAVGLVLVAHTYAQQRRVLRGMVAICAYCKKIRIEHEAWERVEEYITRHSRAFFTHGICPSCYDEVLPPEEAEEAPPYAPPGSTDGPGAQPSPRDRAA